MSKPGLWGPHREESEGLDQRPLPGRGQQFQQDLKALSGVLAPSRMLGRKEQRGLGAYLRETCLGLS